MASVCRDSARFYRSSSKYLNRITARIIRHQHYRTMSASEPKVVAFSRFQLPGLNLPLNWTPHEAYSRFIYNQDANRTDNYPAQGEGRNLFRTALNDADIQDGYVSLPMTTLREFTMLHIMNSITDKPGWEEKVFDDTIANKWKTEALNTPGRDVSQKMVDWVIEELRFKAKIFKQTSAVSVFNGDVVKSDTAISSDIRESLKAAVRSLEDIPKIYKDYHPGSDGKVLDLVHPSLFPLVYGTSRVLEDSIIGIDDCIQSCGNGTVVPIRPDEECKLDWKGSLDYNWDRRHGSQLNPYSKNFQWLPSDVEIAKDGKATFSSYINNLHPQKHQDLYAAIEAVLDRAIPLWNMTLTPLKMTHWPRSNRIPYEAAEYDPDPEEIPDEEGPQREEGENEDDFYTRREDWKLSVAKVIQPEPGAFHPVMVPDYMKDDYPESGTADLKPEKPVDLKRDYTHRGLQVIVKLANIELTPEKPEYEGGAWHVEGQLNEHICATALYYYDNKNISATSDNDTETISDSRLAFRQQSSDDTMEIGYEQDRHEWLNEVFGCKQYGPRVQEVGSVACKEGRLLTFPNILQHRVQPFKLADPTQPGHRKILALFLVDPGIRIISTANVPPQQRDWWSESVIKDFARSGKGLAKLSPELKDKVFESVDDFPISMERAKEIRLMLMEERKKYVVQSVDSFETQEFSLCEH